MWELFGVFMVALYIAYIAKHLWKIRAERLRCLRLWRSAMAQCKVGAVKSSGLWAWRAMLTARAEESLEVRITKALGAKAAVVVIEGAKGFSVLELRRQMILKLWKREIEVGDKAFDDRFIVEGPVRSVSALLDATVRGQLVRADADCRSLEIGDGRLRAEVSEEKLARVLPVLLDIGRKLAEPVDMYRQIAQNARQDPEAGVRLFNLLLLARELPRAPETLEALRAACSDASPEVRLQAAMELGEEGRNVLLQLADSSEDDASSARAVTHLGPELPLERVREILSRSLDQGLLQTARACLEALGHRGAAAIGILARVMTEQKGELASAAAVALGATGEEAAEPPLLQVLQSEDSDLRDAAAAALGKVGTAAAVQPLQEAAERFLIDFDLHASARRAIAKIQSRLEGASPGQLSLAGTEAGQLSLAQADAGQLSLAHAEVPLLPHATDEPEQPSPNARETPGVETV